MPERDTERLEKTSADPEVLEEMRRIAEKSSAHSPYFDNIHGYQELAEVSKVEDWAKGMGSLGHSIGGIRLNLDENGRPDDPPDVLAEMDSVPIGIEVTDLMEYPRVQALCVHATDGKEAKMTWRQRRDGKFDFHWHGAELDPATKAKYERTVAANPALYKGWVEWTLEDFQTRLAEIVRTKDGKLGTKKACRMRLHGEDSLDSRLQCSLLLIFTPEQDLQEDLAEYLEKTELDRPRNFDRVFLMGDYVAGQPEGRHPVFEVRLTR